MTYADLERRYNGPIPQRAFAAVRAGTLQDQIRRALTRIETERQAAHRRMAQWRMELSVALGRIKAECPPGACLSAAILDARRRAYDVHRPHVRIPSRTAVRWTEHLGELLIKQAKRRNNGDTENG